MILAMLPPTSMKQIEQITEEPLVTPLTLARLLY